MGLLRALQDYDRARSRIICFPHAGGSANYFRSWLPYAPPAIVMAVQYPGRADRLLEPCYDDLLSLAADCTAEILATTGPPLVLFGHSMGATVAFEVARGLELAGACPRLLVASAARAPHDASRGAGGNEVWNDDSAMERIAALGHAPPPLLEDPRLRELVLPYLRADYEMLQAYQFRPGLPLRCPVRVVVGSHDPDVGEDQGAVWASLTSAEFELATLPGGHFYLDDVDPSLLLGPL